MFTSFKEFPLFKKLSKMIILAFILIYLISNIIISVSYYNYFENMMLEKLNQSVATASFSQAQSFFDTIKREALELAKEEPLKDYLNGTSNAESTMDFLKRRTDVSVSQFIEVYSASKDEAIFYDEPGDFFHMGKGNLDVDFGDSDYIFLPVIVSEQEESSNKDNLAPDYTVIYQKISDDGSYIATGLSAYVTRNSILSGFILPTTVSYNDIRDGTVENTNSNMYLVNSDGIILSDYYYTYAGQSLTQYDFYSDFENSEFGEENQLFTYEQSSYLMSCAYQEKPGLYVVGVIQKQDILSAVTPTLLTLALLILISLTIFCSLCIWLLYRAFTPYEKLVNKVSKNSKSELGGAELLGDAIEKGDAAKQKAYELALSDYIHDREIDLNTISDIERQYPGKYVLVSCFIDDYDGTSPYTLHQCRQTIQNAFMVKVLCLCIDKNKLVFILCGESTERDISDVLIECQNILMQSDISTSYIIGKTQSHLKDINNSYYSMQKIMFMSVCYGPESIISDFEGEDHVEFPPNAITTLIGYINTGEKDKITELLDQIFDECAGKKNSLISIYLLQIALSIISHIASFYENQDIFDYQDVINKVTEASSLADAKKSISQLCFDACNHLSSIQNKAKSKPNIETKIIEYINQYYSDPNLSLAFISNMFGYSPKYLGRIFKNYTNMFFSQYLTDLRMKKARELVLNTDIPIAEIYESVGITTLQHFYRLFKKQYGNSPAAMRKNNRNFI